MIDISIGAVHKGRPHEGGGGLAQCGQVMTGGVTGHADVRKNNNYWAVKNVFLMFFICSKNMFLGVLFVF